MSKRRYKSLVDICVVWKRERKERGEKDEMCKHQSLHGT